MVDGLDPDQGRRYVGPDLDPNCLQGYQQMAKVAANMVNRDVRSVSCSIITIPLDQLDFQLIRQSLLGNLRHELSNQDLHNLAYALDG